MTYEKEIPDYAMLPAKEMEETLIIPVTKGAVYAPMQVTNITEKPKTTITVEEDILVPDTKPDLAEILMAVTKATINLTTVGSIPKYSATPPQTPNNILFLDLQSFLLFFIIFPSH